MTQTDSLMRRTRRCPVCGKRVTEGREWDVNTDSAYSGTNFMCEGCLEQANNGRRVSYGAMLREAAEEV